MTAHNCQHCERTAAQVRCCLGNLWTRVTCIRRLHERTSDDTTPRFAIYPRFFFGKSKAEIDGWGNALDRALPGCDLTVRIVYEKQIKVRAEVTPTERL